MEVDTEYAETLATYHKDWVSSLKCNRKLEVHSFQLKDANGKAIELDGPHIKVEVLVPLIRSSAYRKIVVREQPDWCFTFCVRVPGLWQSAID